jgi:hypothetical protein
MKKKLVIKNFLKANVLLSNESEDYFKGRYSIRNFEIIILCILVEFSFGTFICILEHLFAFRRIPRLHWSSHLVLS